MTPGPPAALVALVAAACAPKGKRTFLLSITCKAHQKIIGSGSGGVESQIKFII